MLKKVTWIQMEGVLEWLRRLRCCVRLDPLIFSAIMVSFWSNVFAAQTSGPCECDQQCPCPKTRELVTTIWGGAFTLFVLSFDSWGRMKLQMNNDESTPNKVKGILFVIMAILNPVAGLVSLVEDAVWSYHTRRSMHGFTVLSLFLPWTKHPAKILFNCQVVITVPTMISIPGNLIAPNLPSLSEAVVIGRGQEESRETRNIHLAYNGVEVLLQMDVLPPYDQLKVLQGNSGFATVISAVQSLGYIYGVVVRTIQGLPVSPIEVVALMLSLLILIKALLHNVASTCHRPLHVYLTDGQAQTFEDTCKHYTTPEVPMSHVVVGSSMIIMLLLSSVVIYYIIHMWHTTRIVMVVPIMLQLVGFYLQVWGYIRWENIDYLLETFFFSICSIINVTSYILALIVTIEYWKVDRLNAKTSSMLAQIFPYIG